LATEQPVDEQDNCGVNDEGYLAFIDFLYEGHHLNQTNNFLDIQYFDETWAEQESGGVNTEGYSAFLDFLYEGHDFKL